MISATPVDGQIIVTWTPTDPRLTEFTLDPSTMTIGSPFGTTTVPSEFINSDTASFVGPWRGWVWQHVDAALQPGTAGTVDGISVTLARVADSDDVLLTITGSRFDADGIGEYVYAGFLYADPAM